MDAPAPSIARPGFRRPQPALVGAWLLGFGPVVYLALDGGGYDLVVRSEVGILGWWVVLLGAILGVLPRTRLSPAAWGMLALFGAFLAWTWLGAGWSTSAERSLVEAGRVASYGGVLVLGASVIDRDNLPGLIGGLGCAIGLVAAVAILSRLEPAWTPPGASRALRTASRLDYPFNYSDAVGEFAALGLPLLLHLATCARSLAGRALAAATMPVIVLCVALSVSRGGALACLVSLALYFALTPRRPAAMAAGLVAAAASAAVILALLSRPGLRAGLQSGPGLAAERHQMLVIVLAACLAAAAIQAGLDRFRVRGERAVRSKPGTGRARGAAAALAVVLVVAGMLLLTGELGQLLRDFKQPSVQGAGGGDVYSRLLTLSGSHRYQYWQVAVDAWRTHPWRGIGPGGFEFWWAEHNSLGEFVRNAHSLYFETLGELGVVGLTLVCAFLLLTLAAGARASLKGTLTTRSALAASLAGVAGFAAAAGFDWIWQFAAIPAVGLLLAGAMLSGARVGGSGGIRTRILLGLAAAPALLAIAVPLLTTVAVRQSEAAARTGNNRAALEHLARAQRLEPAAASPRLQRALVYEQIGTLPAANRAIGEAVAREPTNWRVWLVASRIEAEAGRPGPALVAYRRARSLNPTSVVFRR